MAIAFVELKIPIFARFNGAEYPIGELSLNVDGSFAVETSDGADDG